MSNVLKQIKDRHERERAELLLPALSRLVPGEPMVGEYGGSLVVESTSLGRVLEVEAQLWGGFRIAAKLGDHIPRWLGFDLTGAPNGAPKARTLSDDRMERDFLSPRVWAHEFDKHAARELYTRLPAPLIDDIDTLVGLTEGRVSVRENRLELDVPSTSSEDVALAADALAHGLRLTVRLAAAIDEAWRTP